MVTVRPKKSPPGSPAPAPRKKSPPGSPAPAPRKESAATLLREAQHALFIAHENLKGYIQSHNYDVASRAAENLAAAQYRIGKMLQLGEAGQLAF